MAARYCIANRLDPLRKPVHIVPVYSAEKGTMVDAVWPGINLYETVAHRTGVFAGKDAAEFGPMKTFSFQPINKVNGKDLPPVVVEMPEWARVTVYRFVQGQKCSFTSDLIFYDEFVGIVKGKGEKAGTPNDMWRTKGKMMMGKVALAFALRLGFPEIGNEPTAEEMEGREVEVNYEPSAKDVQERAKAKVAEKAKVAHTELFEQEPDDDTVDAEVLPKGEADSKPVEPTSRQVLEAAKELHEEAGNDQVVEAIQATIANQEKITQKEVGALNKLCLSKGLKIKDAVDLMETKFQIKRADWVNSITLDQYQEVFDEIDAR